MNHPNAPEIVFGSLTAAVPHIRPPQSQLGRTDAPADSQLSDDSASLMLSKCAFQLARSLGVDKVMVQASEVQHPQRFEFVRETQQVVWLMRSPKSCEVNVRYGDQVLELPSATYTRENQLKVGMLLAVLSGVVDLDENVVCLSGIANSGTMDTLFVANPRRDFPWFQSRTLTDLQKLVATREFVSILGVALRLAHEGREGKPIGTCFVLGQEAELQSHVRQLVLNPLAGHPANLRNIHNPSLFETIREFAVLDGAFVVDTTGVVQSAGTYLNAQASKSIFTPGLGARHAAARAITEITSAMSIVVSSSSGTVSVFHDGLLVLELENSETRNPIGKKTKRAS